MYYSYKWFAINNIYWISKRCIIENGHSFEWNEDRETVFLKWIDFNRDMLLTKVMLLLATLWYLFHILGKICNLLGLLDCTPKVWSW